MTKYEKSIVITAFVWNTTEEDVKKLLKEYNVNKAPIFLKRFIESGARRMESKFPRNLKKLEEMIKNERYSTSSAYNGKSGGTMTIGGQASLNTRGPAKMRL